MRAETKRPRRRWPWIAGAAAIAIAILITIIMTGHGPPGPPATSPSNPPTHSPAGIGTDADPTGCLGGSTRDSAMVLAAGASAPHTSNGAIEVSTAFVRWLNRYPYPPAVDITVIQKDALSTRAPTKDIVAFFDTKPNLSGGLVADGTPYNLSTVPGVFHLESATANEVTTSIGTALVVDGALSPTLKGSITVTVAWEDGGWKFVSSEGTRTTQELYTIGRPFSSGC